MASEPNQRYSSGAEIARDVQHWLADEPVQAYRESVIERFSRWSRRHRTFMRTAVAALMIIACVSILAAVLINSARKEQVRLRVVVEEKQTELQQAYRDLEASYYPSNIRLAFSDALANNATNARTLLDACPEHLRDWEWNFVSNSLAAIQEFGCVEPPGSPPSVVNVAWAADGSQVAVSYKTGDVRIWNLRKGVLSTEYKLGNFTIQQMADDWTPDRLVGVTSDATLVSWSPESGRLYWSRRLPGDRCQVAFSPHAGHIALYSNPPFSGKLATGRRTIQILAASDGAVAEQIACPIRWVSGLAYTADGRHLVAAANSFGRLAIWDVKSYSLSVTKQSEVKESIFYPAPVNHREIALSKDGYRVVCRRNHETLTVYDSPTLASAKTIRVDSLDIIGAVSTSALSENGNLLAAATVSQRGFVWDLARDVQIGTVPGNVRALRFLSHDRLVSVDIRGRIRVQEPYDLQFCLRVPGVGVALPRTGSRLAIKQDDRIAIFDASSGFGLATVSSTAGASSVIELDDSGRIMALQSDDFVSVWNVDESREIIRIPKIASVIRNTVRLLPSGDAVVVADGNDEISVDVYNLNDRRRTLRIETARQEPWHLAVDPTEETVALVGKDWLAGWSLKNGRQVRLPPGRKFVEFSGSGKRIVSGDENAGCAMWQMTETGWTRKWNLKQHGLRHATFLTSETRVLCSFTRGRFFVVNAEDGAVVFDFNTHDVNADLADPSLGPCVSWKTGLLVFRHKGRRGQRVLSLWNTPFRGIQTP
jgi:WD40 repeat protein